MVAVYKPREEVSLKSTLMATLILDFRVPELQDINPCSLKPPDSVAMCSSGRRELGATRAGFEKYLVSPRGVV